MKCFLNLVALFFLVSFVPTGSAQSVNMGVTGLLPNIDSGNAGVLLAQQATLSQAATLQSISLYIVTANGTLRLGLYDSTGINGNPGNKLAETVVITPVAGWNTVPVVYHIVNALEIGRIRRRDVPWGGKWNNAVRGRKIGTTETRTCHTSRE